MLTITSMETKPDFEIIFGKFNVDRLYTLSSSQKENDDDNDDDDHNNTMYVTYMCRQWKVT
jgi:hypothetical protein